MKRLTTTLLVTLAMLQVAEAQHTIAIIRKAYQEQKELMALMSDNFPAEGCPPEYYHLHVAQNLPGTGPHHENIRMYYGEVETEEDVISPPHRLTFVSSKYNFAAREFYEEYLYDKQGQVMFIYARTPDVDFPKVHELRIYLDGQRLLWFSVKESEGQDHLLFKDIYTGDSIPEPYKAFCSRYQGQAQHFLKLFKSIEERNYE